VQGRVRPSQRLTTTPLAGARARHLPGGDVEAVPEVDQGDVDDQGRQRWLVVLAPGVVLRADRVVVAPRGRLLVALGLTVTRGKIVDIDVVADPTRLRQLDLAVLDD
jgi:hypothetical protein